MKVNLVSGYTLIHEHTTIDLSKVKNNDDCNLNCFDQTLEEFKQLYQHGVRNIVDVTAMGMGRNLDYSQKIAQQTKINILQSTGFYKEPFLPNFVYDESIDQLKQRMIDELTLEIENSGIKASLIGEIGTSNNSLEPMEKKVFDASILAAKATGCVISTHTTLGTMAIQQAEFFLEHGCDPSKIIIGHQDLSGNLDQIFKLIDMGFYVGFDTIGKNNYFPDEDRAQYLLELQNTNRIDHICLSLDITRKSNLSYQGGIGYNYLFTHFIPLLKSKGITQHSIELMLIENPCRLFGEKS